MKKKLSLKKIIGAAVIIVMMLTASVNNVVGQEATCTKIGGHIIRASGNGCSKADAIKAMKHDATAEIAALCPKLLCDPQTSRCVYLSYTKLHLNANVVDSTIDVPKTECRGGKRHYHHRDYRVDCKCITAQRISGNTTEKSFPAGTLKLFPNPATQEVTVNVSSYQGKVQLQIVNVLGQQVFNKSVELKGEHTYSINVSPLVKGMYKVILIKGSDLSTGTFVKE